MEIADRTVSTDLLLRSLFRLGANRREVARLLIEPRRTRAAWGRAGEAGDLRSTE